MPCERCARLRLEYRLLAGSKKYSECTRRGCGYNAQDDSLTQFARIDKEYTRLDTEIAASKIVKEISRIKLKRLKLQKEALKRRELT